jgi:hypothetical protein
MTLRNRRSPSGPSTESLLPFNGANVITPSVTHYLAVAALGTSATQADGQAQIPETGVLTSLTVQNVVAGTVSGSVTYNVLKNGVIIPLATVPPSNATVTVPNTSQEPATVNINALVKGPAPSAPLAVPPIPVTVGDLISIEAVSTAFGGTTPVVRVSLKYQPGGPR